MFSTGTPSAGRICSAEKAVPARESIMILSGKLLRCGPYTALHTTHRHMVSAQSLRQRWWSGKLPVQTRVAAVDYRVAAPPAKFDLSGTTDEVRSYLTRLGWERAWVDGITERIYKLEFETTASRVEEVIKYLEGLGLPTHWVCNLAARVPAILGRDPESDLRSVVEYIQSQGVQGEALLRLLRDHPRLLLFTPSPDTKVLHSNEARATVDVIQDPSRGPVANVSYWREGATFETAPVSPIKPRSQ